MYSAADLQPEGCQCLESDVAPARDEVDSSDGRVRAAEGSWPTQPSQPVQKQSSRRANESYEQYVETVSVSPFALGETSEAGASQHCFAGTLLLAKNCLLSRSIPMAGETTLP